MKLLVTGGAGFIGSNFVRHVLREKKDWQVTNLDKLTYAGNLENLRDVESDTRYTFVHGDIADRDLIGEFFTRENFDVVVNFAAESHVDRSILDADPFIKTNIHGMYILLDAARRHGLGLFLQVSTDEVYGSLGPDDAPFTEDHHLHPNSPYSASKAAADLLCRAYHVTYGLPVVITRCSNNYGPYQFPEKLIPLMILNASEGISLPVYGDGLNIRDWIHVEDHCRGLIAALQSGRAGAIYNFGGCAEKTNLEVVQSILKLLNRPANLIKFVADRPGHDHRYAMDITRTQSELGWHPEFSFEKGLAATVRWYLENPEWVQRVRDGNYQEYYQQMYEKRER